MFMEILYKQTALFPLSSCRYKAAVTFFIDGLKHLAMPPPPPRVDLGRQPTHRSMAGWVPRCSLTQGSSWTPSPEPSSKAGILTAGSLLCWGLCSGGGRGGQCLLSVRRCPSSSVSRSVLCCQAEKLCSDDRGRPRKNEDMHMKTPEGCQCYEDSNIKQCNSELRAQRNQRDLRSRGV